MVWSSIINCKFVCWFISIGFVLWVLMPTIAASCSRLFVRCWRQDSIYDSRAKSSANRELWVGIGLGMGFQNTRCLPFALSFTKAIVSRKRSDERMQACHITFDKKKKVGKTVVVLLGNAIWSSGCWNSRHCSQNVRSETQLVLHGAACLLHLCQLLQSEIFPLWWGLWSYLSYCHNDIFQHWSNILMCIAKILSGFHVSPSLLQFHPTLETYYFSGLQLSFSI